MRTNALVGSVAALLVAQPLFAATYYVAPPPAGANANAGSSGAPWATLQHAADQVGAGDTVEVAAGTYQGFYLSTSGTAAKPITFHAATGVIVNQDNGTTADGINLEGASYVVIDGFTVRGVTRAGIRTVTASHVTIQHNVTDQNGTWGILTGFVDDLSIIDNECSNSGTQHGIYVGNSGDRPLIRANRVHDNNANGIHMNGDLSQGGDGIISNAVVEQNIIYGNGVAGGSGINCDGVQDSLIQNNLLYDNHASGISLYMIDAAEGAKRNKVINNTIVMASDARWALNVQNGSTGTIATNNIFLNRVTTHGAIDISADSFPITSDYNVVKDLFSNDGNFVSLAAWRTATSQDTHSVIAMEAAVFAIPATDDYELLAGSPAIDMGTTVNAPSSDLLGRARPLGNGFDVGAYEFDASAGGSGSGGASAGGAGNAGASGSGGANSGGASASAGGVASSSGGAASTSGGSVGTAGAGGNGAGGTPGAAGAGGSSGASTDAGASSGGGNGAAGSKDSGGCGCRSARTDTRGNGIVALAALFAAIAIGRKKRG